VKSNDELKIRNRSLADRNIFQEERALHHEQARLMSHIAPEYQTKCQVSEETHRISRDFIT